MKDGTKGKTKAPGNKVPQGQVKEVAVIPQKPKAPVRQAEIATGIKENQVIKQILKTPITLSLQKIFASSRELSDQLSEMLKRKNPRPIVALNTGIPADDEVTVNGITAIKARLIKLELECNGQTVTTIVDTGSEINVASRKVWERTFKKPMNEKVL